MATMSMVRAGVEEPAASDGNLWSALQSKHADARMRRLMRL